MHSNICYVSVNIFMTILVTGKYLVPYASQSLILRREIKLGVQKAEVCRTIDCTVALSVTHREIRDHY